MLRLSNKCTIVALTAAVLLVTHLGGWRADAQAPTTGAPIKTTTTRTTTTTATTPSSTTAAVRITTATASTSTNSTPQPSPATTPTSPKTPSPPPTPTSSSPTDYCEPSLCEIYNGTHILHLPNIACGNSGEFGERCGPMPKLIYMSERRQELLLAMHNLVRNQIAGGNLSGYQPATHMPLLKWDKELEAMAELHAKRCLFAHDLCRNTPKFRISGQNIGYFWIGRKFKSHSRRMKSFVIHWFREYEDANQTFIDNYHPHPMGKKIGHFTMLVADRVRRVGCAAVRFLDPSVERSQFILTCNYDYNNIFGEPVYQSGPPASKCRNGVSKAYPALCNWIGDANEFGDADADLEDNNALDNNIPL